MLLEYIENTLDLHKTFVIDLILEFIEDRNYDMMNEIFLPHSEFIVYYISAKEVTLKDNTITRMTTLQGLPIETLITIHDELNEGFFKVI